MEKIKHLWKGTFNYQHEIHIERAYAFTERQAWILFCLRLAKKLDRDPHSIMGLYGGQRDNYRIIKEFEFEEVEEKSQELRT